MTMALITHMVKTVCCTHYSERNTFRKLAFAIIVNITFIRKNIESWTLRVQAQHVNSTCAKKLNIAKPFHFIIFHLL